VRGGPLLSTVLLATKRGGLSPQQVFGVTLVVGLLVGWGGYVVWSLSRRDPGAPVGSEIELAPNRREYLDDAAMEGPRLDRVLLFSFGMLVLIAVGLPLYWLREPGRQSGAIRGFDKRAAQRGGVIFADTNSPTPGIHFGCAGCHGAAGQGGSANYTITQPAHPEKPPRQVTWAAPPLNTVLYRFSKEAVRTIITYGRANTPMPAWGAEGGGAMNPQQVSDLVAYIGSITLPKDRAIKFWQDAAAAEAKAEGKAVIDGEVLFNTNCARCHTKGWSYGAPDKPGAGGQYAPNITGGAEVRQFPNEADQIDFVTNGAEYGKPYGAGGIGQTAGTASPSQAAIPSMAGGGMPHFGGYLSPDEIKAIVEYERSLG